MGKSKRLTRDAILNANDLRQEEIDVPEWGGTLIIRGLSLAEKNLALERAKRGDEVDGLHATLATFCLGVVEPQFDYMQDRDVLRNKSAAVERVAMRIFALSGVGKDALEQAVKNSETTKSDTLSTN